MSFEEEEYYIDASFVTRMRENLRKLGGGLKDGTTKPPEVEKGFKKLLKGFKSAGGEELVVSAEDLKAAEDLLEVCESFGSDIDLLVDEGGEEAVREWGPVRKLIAKVIEKLAAAIRTMRQKIPGQSFSDQMEKLTVSLAKADGRKADKIQGKIDKLIDHASDGLKLKGVKDWLIKFSSGELFEHAKHGGNARAAIKEKAVVTEMKKLQAPGGLNEEQNEKFIINAGVLVEKIDKRMEALPIIDQLTELIVALAKASTPTKANGVQMNIDSIINHATNLDDLNEVKGWLGFQKNALSGNAQIVDPAQMKYIQMDISPDEGVRDKFIENVDSLVEKIEARIQEVGAEKTAGTEEDSGMVEKFASTLGDTKKSGFFGGAEEEGSTIDPTDESSEDLGKHN